MKYLTVLRKHRTIIKRLKDNMQRLLKSARSLQTMLKDDLVVSLLKRGTCSADKGLSSKQKVILRDAAVIWTEIYEQTVYELYTNGKIPSKSD